MPRGKYELARPYLHAPRTDKPIEQVFSDLQAYSSEVFEDEDRLTQKLDFRVLLPPLYYDGQFVKGIAYSQGVDYLHQIEPRISELFHCVAVSMSHAYPWSEKADGYFAFYKNPIREAWFRREYPDKSHIVLIPQEDADCPDDYFLGPQLGVQKDIPLLCVSQLIECKNIPLLAEAVKVYQRKYDPQVKLHLVIGTEFETSHPDFTGLPEHAVSELRKAEKLVGNLADVITLIPKIPYAEMPTYYSRAKVTVLGSLLEGKNRSIHESMSCDTPVVTFKHFNQYARGETEAIFENAGVYAEHYAAESMADAIHEAIKHYGDFRPRRAFLTHSGRKNCLNKCIDSFPYYCDCLPEYQPSNHLSNLWIDLAMQYSYRLSPERYLYGAKPNLQWVKGPQKISELLNFFEQRHGYFSRAYGL